MDMQGNFAHNNKCVSINSIASKCKNSGLSYHKILQAKSANSKQQSHPPLLCFWWAETCRPPYFCWHYNNSYYIKSSKFHTHRHRLGPKSAHVPLQHKIDIYLLIIKWRIEYHSSEGIRSKNNSRVCIVASPKNTHQENKSRWSWKHFFKLFFFKKKN